MALSKKTIYVIAFIAIAACVVFGIVWPTLHAQFSLEDWINVRTGHIPNFSSFLHVFTRPWPYNTSSSPDLNWRGTPSVKGDHYDPLYSLTFFVDRSIWGVNPFGFRLTNAILYLFCGVFVFYLAYLVFKKWAAAFAAGIIYLLQAVHYPALFVVNTRTESLMALFGLPAIIFYITYREKGARLYYWLSILFFMFSFLSKENAVFIPLVILLYDALYHYGLGKKRIITDFAGFCGAIVIYMIMRVSALGGVGQYSQLSPRYFGQYPFLIAKGLILSVYDLIFTIAGNISYIQNYLWLVVLLSTIFLAGIIRAFSYKDSDFYKKTVFFALSYLLLVAITLPIFSARYLFLPSAFFDLFIVDVLMILFSHRSSAWDRLLTYGCSIVVVGLGLLWGLTWASLAQGVVTSSFWLNKFYTEMGTLLPTINSNQRIFLLDPPSEIDGFGLVTVAQPWFTDSYNQDVNVHAMSFVFSRTASLPNMVLNKAGEGKFIMTLQPDALSSSGQAGSSLQRIINKISIVSPDTDQAIYLPELDMGQIVNGEVLDNQLAQYHILNGSGYAIRSLEVDVNQASTNGYEPVYIFFNGSDFVKVD